MKIEPLKVIFYETENGKSPCEKWLATLDNSIEARVIKRLRELQKGHYGDHKPIPGTRGVFELRMTFGGAIRIYCGKCDGILVVLLEGGNKGTQAKDIAKATEYWKDYRSRI